MYAFEQIDVTAVSTLTVPQKTQRVLVQAVGANVRYRLDGNSPTASIGQVLAASGAMLELVTVHDWSNARFISTGGAATIEVHYQLTDV